jgi:hypothetical protein
MSLNVAAGHPRVMVRPDDLPLLRKRAQTTHKKEYDALMALAATGGKDSAEGSDHAQTAWRLSFLYLLSGDQAHAAAAQCALEQVLNRDVSGGYFEAQRRMRSLSCGYDWCFDAFTPHFRQRLAHGALAHCHAIHANEEVWPENYNAGHEINMVPHMLSTGIAACDEIYGARQVLEDTVPRFENMLKCYAHFLKGDSFQQSYSYTAAYVPEIATIFQTLESGLGMKMFEQNPWFANFINWWTYALRSDETFIRYGDYFCSHPVFKNNAYWRPFAVAAAKYRNPLAQWWVNRFTISANEPEVIIFEERENAVAPEGPEKLRRTKLFDPMGVAIARGDWSDGTVAALKCTPVYLHNHCHRDQNQITVFHKGDLAIDSGVYDGYETPQWYNYYIRTIAHNTIVVHDPEEKFISRGRQYANDGGQRFINEPNFSPRSIEAVKSEAFKDGKILSYAEQKDHSYVCGDASNCYSPKKLKRFLRHVIFVLDWPRPATVSLVVVDEVEVARSGLTPRFLLHTMEEPEVSGSSIVNHEGGGRLSTFVLQPQAAKIEKIGGEGKEFWVDGQNYPLKSTPGGPHTPGRWRVEVSPADAGLQTRFVTMLIPGDAESPAETTPTVQVTSAGIVVSHQDLSVGFFEKAPQPLAAKRTISVTLVRP